MPLEPRLNQRKLTNSVHTRGQRIRPEKRLQNHVEKEWESQSAAERSRTSPREALLDEYLETEPGTFAARRAMDALIAHDEKGGE